MCRGTEAKNISKSIRLTPTVYEYIEKYKGDGFNDKLINMVTFCMTEEKNINKKVKEKNTELEQLTKKIAVLKSSITDVEQIKKQLDNAFYTIEKITKNCTSK